jgi:O-acetyl-ADP-ribose deacetylase
MIPSIVDGDITALDVDAIVNAANESLLGGCPTGAAKITQGYALKARYVIHTVGPVWQGGGEGEEALLTSCYRHSLALAVDHDVQSVAFPAISTGVYRFPLVRAADIAVGTVIGAAADLGFDGAVVFCCFGGDATAVYSAALARHMS